MFLFPQIPPGHVANEQIAANMIANIFGLGWAATPAGLEAMESLEELEESRRKEMEVQNGAAKRKKGHRTKPAPVPRGTANAEMCTFLIMNISSLQLIPVNIIAFRSQYGSVNPAEIIGPAILSTVISPIQKDITPVIVMQSVTASFAESSTAPVTAGIVPWNAENMTPDKIINAHK